MKKTRILFILFLVVIELSACGNKSTQPGRLEHNDSRPEPIEASTQEPNAALSQPLNVERQIEQIKNGDFSNLRELSDYEGEVLKMICPKGDTESEKHEWIECDLNENGLKGLILQQKSSRPLKIKRIEAVFAVKDSEARLVCSVFGRQGTDFIFLAKNGNIINRYGIYGTESYDNYTHYVFHGDWSVEEANNLTVIQIYDWAINELKEDGLFDEQVKDSPYWAKAGVYYFTNGRDESLDESQFLEAFEEMTGYSFYDDNPLKPDWAN